MLLPLLTRILAGGLALALVIPANSTLALSPQSSERANTERAVILRDLAFLGIPPNVSPRIQRLLPGSAERVLGAAVDKHNQSILLWIVEEDGSEHSHTVRLAREVIDVIVRSGSCAEPKRCKQVLCPICGSRRSILSDPRAVVFRDEYTSPLALMQQIRKVEHAKRNLEQRIVDLRTEMSIHLNYVGFDGRRDRMERVRQIRDEIGQLKADIRSAKREKSHLIDDFNDWHQLLGNPYRLKADITTELRVLGVAASIIGRILSLIPHPVARVLGVALSAGGSGLSLWLVRTDGSEERFIIPLDRDESRLLERSGICNDTNRCGQVRCPVCGWKNAGDRKSSDPRLRVLELEYGSPVGLARTIREAEKGIRQLERDLDSLRGALGGQWGKPGFDRSFAERWNTAEPQVRNLKGRMWKQKLHKEYLEDDFAAWRQFLKDSSH